MSVAGVWEAHGDRNDAIPKQPSIRRMRSSTPRTVPPDVRRYNGTEMIGMRAGHTYGVLLSNNSGAESADLLPSHSADAADITL